MAGVEGKDFEWVVAKDSKGNPVLDGKGKPAKTRRFFGKAEKAAMSAPKAAPKAAPTAKPKAKPVPKAAPTANRPAKAAEISGQKTAPKTATRPAKPAEVLGQKAAPSLSGASRSTAGKVKPKSNSVMSVVGKAGYDAGSSAAKALTTLSKLREILAGGGFSNYTKKK